MSETAAIKERPILFSGPMVRAILDGRKTQTRRIVKPQPPAGVTEASSLVRSVNHPVQPHLEFHWTSTPVGGDIDDMEFVGDWFTCPYGAPGDRLWVRETFAHVLADESTVGTGKRRTIYLADLSMCNPKWTPSIHMPRWASRITLEITGINVERLQDISDPDAIAEGLTAWTGPEPVRRTHYGLSNADVFEVTPRKAFFRLWKQINGEDALNSNPWVWAITFRRLETA